MTVKYITHHHHISPKTFTAGHRTLSNPYSQIASDQWHEEIFLNFTRDINANKELTSIKNYDCKNDEKQMINLVFITILNICFVISSVIQTSKRDALMLYSVLQTICIVYKSEFPRKNVIIAFAVVFVLLVCWSF